MVLTERPKYDFEKGTPDDFQTSFLSPLSFGPREKFLGNNFRSKILTGSAGTSATPINRLIRKEKEKEIREARKPYDTCH